MLACAVCLLIANGCDVYIASGNDAQEAIDANTFLNTQLSSDENDVIVNWFPTKDFTVLTVLAPVDPQTKKSALDALRKQQAAKGWRSIQVVFKNGDTVRLIP